MTNKEKVRLLKQAIRAFTAGWPDGAWEGQLHEAGCPGVHLRKRERDVEGEFCLCDGDFLAALVKRALRVRA